MKVSAVVTLLLVTLVFAQQPQFIDFTYTHVLQEAGASSDPSETITIYPDTHQVERYNFPQICDLKGKLLEGMDNSSAVTSSIDVDDHLRDLRSRVLSLLKLAEQMKNLRVTLSELEESYDSSVEGFNASVFTSDLSRLAKRQQELANLREKIENSTLKLNMLIDQYNLNPKSQQFLQVNIRYKLTLANAKINFYKKLKDESSSKRASQKPVNYDEFFSQIETSFDHVNKHLSDIDSIIDNYSTKKKLQQKISSYHNKIEIDRLLLNEKVDCNSSKTKFRTHKGLKQEIKKTFQDLRQKKKQFAGMNNTQCEGVSKKLQEKIRSQLKIINRAYICSEGLQEIKEDLRKSENDLENLNKKLKDLQLGDISMYQRGYNKSIADIEVQLKKAKSFKVEQYIHSEQELSKLLSQAFLQKQQAEKDLRALPDKTGSKVSFKQLEQLVQEIKREKAKYCQEYAEYQHDQRETWSKIHRAEKRQRQLAHVRNHYISQAQKYLDYQTEYNLLSLQINHALLQGGSNL